VAENDNRYKRLLDSIEAERQAEEEYFRKLSTSKTTKERIESGILWQPVEISRQHYTVGEYVELELVPASPSASSRSNNFKVGASAIFYIQKDERLELRGAISYANRKKVRIILAADVIAKEHILKGGTMGIELIYDDRSYKVMKDSVKTVMKVKEGPIAILRDAVDKQIIDQTNEKTDIFFKDDHLNDSQQDAVSGSLGAQYLSVIHGPPGTGKTTTLVELIRHSASLQQKILVTAPSNGAVDLLTRQIHESGVNVIRIGNVTRIGDHIADLCLDEKIRNHKDWQHIKQVKIEAETAHREAGKYKRKFGSQERMNRGLMYKEARQLKNWARDLEDRLVEQVLSDAQVVCATLIGCANRSISDLHFDMVVIDEASQALEPESWTAILKADKVVMAGDHQQLPPTVKSAQAKELGFEETLLDRLTDHIEQTYLLDTQYRMHPKILTFSNELFYGGLLKTDKAISSRTSRHAGEPIVYIDTSGCGFEEEINPETLSKYNRQEYLIVREHILSLEPLLAGQSIGIISPYKAQVQLIRREIEEDKILRSLNIEINSIDGFQGQEKDVIYISLVRSNDRGELGFLTDYRRLNVAMTRAKEKLVIIGDMATLGFDKCYLELADYIEEHGRYQSAWEYMS